jgi:hypothetical protein
MLLAALRPLDLLILYVLPASKADNLIDICELIL